MANSRFTQPAAKKKAPKPAQSEQLPKVLMAVAAASNAMKLNASGMPAKGSARTLLQRQLRDAQVGLGTKPGIEAMKSHLARLMPEHAATLRQLALRPASTIGELLAGVEAIAQPQSRAIDIFPSGPLREMKRTVVNAYGKSFAGKCTEELLRVLAMEKVQVRALGFGRESAAPTPPLILELEPPPFQHWAEMEEARRQFLQTIGPMRAVMERKAGGKAVEVCWLNGSLRVRGGAEVVAEVAEDAGLLRIDRGRRLVREMNVCGPTVGAVEFRNATGRTGAGVRIGMIDGEVQVDHPGLAPRVVHQHNFVAEGFGNPDPHGTMAAGIAAGRHASLVGIAPGATIFSYKVFPTAGSIASADDFEGAQAIEMALRDRMHIVNCSWGAGLVGDGTDRFAVACNRAWAGGLVVVKSAGNEGEKSGQMTSPADANGVIVVAATDRTGTKICSYSSRGPTRNGKRPHVAAPGGEDGDEIRSTQTGGGFGRTEFGTSCATPIVSGLAALLLEGSPGLTPDQVREQLIRMCRPIAGFDANSQGAGLVRMELPT